MKRANFLTVLAASAIALGLTPGLSAVPAYAGGLYINEFATPSMGTAGAGSAAKADDASAVWHNPAGMTRVEGTQIMGGIGAAMTQVEFDPDPATPYPGNDGGDAGGPVPVLGSYGVTDLTEDVKIGMGLFSIAGAALDYGDNWAGRYQVRKVQLLTVSANPSIAVQVNDWLSLGGGGVISYGTLEMHLSVPPGGTGDAKLDGDDWTYGFTLGAHVELSPQTRFGVVYLSETEYNFDGDLEVKPAGISVGTDTRLNMAQLVRVSGYHDLNDKWALLATVGWEDWSAMDNLLVSTNGGSGTIPRNWKDTYHFSFGVHYRPNATWLLQTGMTYDSSPVASSDRTADMPVDRQWRLAAGAQYKVSERFTIGGSIVAMDLGKAAIHNATLSGDYKRNRAIFAAVNGSWKF